VIQTLTADRADEALHEWVLPRALRRGENLLDPHALHAMLKWLTIDAVAVAEEVDRRGLVREGVDELLSGPDGGGVLGHVEVDDPPAVVSEHDENEEDAEASGGHRKEVNRDDVPDVVSEERPPGLRGLGTTRGHEAGDGALGDVDAELEELAVDARRTPQGIRRGHRPDEGGDLGADGWAAASGPAREASPVLAEAAPRPSEDGIRRDDDQGLPPAGPESGQAGPEQTVGRAELGAGRESLVDGERLAQGQVLEGELAVAADEKGEEPE
jgi:hypothetical protein